MYGECPKCGDRALHPFTDDGVDLKLTCTLGHEYELPIEQAR